ncbi:type IV secretory system conjugative DNA transfer family protein [Candidatus Peregrinibacteria bacterium]|nr:type IV secretory system conjugative DNA transfer family protein [Candidatus Peregrinibacteria bacterium]
MVRQAHHDKKLTMTNMSQILEFIKNNYLIIGLIIAGSIFALWLALAIIRYIYHLHRGKNLVFLRITLPRDDSPKDKDKDTDKDFREKISIMAQFFRNIHETRELNIWNTIKSRILRHNVFSFEFVAHHKVFDFYVTTPKYFQGIMEKQITSYYPNADIQPMEPYEINAKDSKIKGFYAYEQRQFWFPIKTFKIVENDPLNDLTNIFTRMEEDETAIIQMVLRPVSNRWHKKAEKFGDAYFKGKKSGSFDIPIIGPILNVLKGIFLGYEKMEIQPKDFNTGYVRMLQPKEEIAKRIGEKAMQPAFETVIRLLTSAKTKSRAEELTNSMVIGLNLFQDPGANWLQTRRIMPFDFINDKWFLFNFRYRLLDCRFLFLGEKKSILSVEELASIYHFPNSKYNQSPNISWIMYKVLPAPVNLPTEGILIGHNLYRGEKKEVRFKRADRSRHHYIIGKSGSGKSALLGYMARQDILNGEGVAIIDPHGDLIEDVLEYIPKERAKDVIIFDPSDQDRPMALNMLDAKDSAEMDLISTQATEIFIKLFGDEIFGPRIQHYFRNACLTLMEDPEEGATLIDIPRIFTDDAFLKYKVGKIKNPVVKSFWQNEYANTGDRERQEMIPYFSAKFGPFITNTIMRNTIGQQKSSFNLRKIMDEGKILLVKLSKGKIGDINTQLLGLVMVSKLQMAAMSRVDIPETQRRDFFLYVDEFQSFATDSFCSILSEARKYHLNLTMAHQYISQLVVTKFGVTSTQIRDAVFGNVGTLSSFRVGAEDAEYLAKEYAPLLTEQDVIGISNYKMYTKLNIDNSTSRPFSISTIWDTTGKNEKIAKMIKEYSRLKNARKREFVEEEITTRIGIDVDAPPVDMNKLPGQPNTAKPPEGNAMANILAQTQNPPPQSGQKT